MQRARGCGSDRLFVTVGARRRGQVASVGAEARPEHGVVVLAALLVLTGTLLMLLPTEPTTIGWFAYAPLPQTVFVPDAGVLVSPRALVGLILAAVGALALAVWGGWAFARRGIPRTEIGE